MRTTVAPREPKTFREMLKGPAVFYRAELKGTSSWANTFLDRDHSGATRNQTGKNGE